MTGLALAGGGVKGAYQVGAYLAFKKCGIKIDGVVGTSIGAFNGAMIAGGKEKELYEFWKNVDIGSLLHLGSKYTESINKKDKFKQFIYGLEEMTLVVKNKGIKTDNLKNTLEKAIDEDTIRASKMDYGLVTVRVNDLKPLYMFLEDIPKGKLAEYILASCNLPVFKLEKFSDNNIYIDGGFYDNNPVNMLINKGYNKIYSVDIQGLGFKQKAKKKKDVEIIHLKPSRFLGGALNIDRVKINENIKLGYYDTLKVLKNYDGYNFIFKKCPDWVYNILAKKADKNLYNKCKKYFKAKDNKELILKAIEYIFIKEEVTYFRVYGAFKQIKEIKDYTDSNGFVYKFVRSLKIL